jgi:hypothetical protein
VADASRDEHVRRYGRGAIRVEVVGDAVLDQGERTLQHLLEGLGIAACVPAHSEHERPFLQRRLAEVSA